MGRSVTEDGSVAWIGVAGVGGGDADAAFAADDAAPVGVLDGVGGWLKSTSWPAWRSAGTNRMLVGFGTPHPVVHLRMAVRICATVSPLYVAAGSAGTGDAALVVEDVDELLAPSASAI